MLLGSGFSQGWGWGGTHAPGYGNVTISYNKIFNVMTKMKDGGGIYVNGYTNDKWTNVMSHNWVDHDMHVFAVYCAMSRLFQTAFLTPTRYMSS